MSTKPLAPEQLRARCPVERFTFQTTADLPATTHIIGQPRGTRAIEFGTGIQSHGYNLYVLGAKGTGRTTAVQRFLEEQTSEAAVPPDWVYVHNFTAPHRPRALALPPGQGRVLRQAVHHFIGRLARDLLEALNTKTYRDTVNSLKTYFKERKEALLAPLYEAARVQGMGLMTSRDGLRLVPLRDDNQIAIENLSPAEREAFMQKREAFHDEMQPVLRQMQQLDNAQLQQLREVTREVAVDAIEVHLADLRAAFAGQEAVLRHFDAVRDDLLTQIERFDTLSPEPLEMDLRRYEVNLIVDRSEEVGAPVVIEDNPTYDELFGRVEYEVIDGELTPHFTNIKAGSLHEANGGYLIITASDLLRHHDAWEALKRALNSGWLSVRTYSRLDGAPVAAKSLDPEPIPLHVKIILLGKRDLYERLYEQDDDFPTLFKVRADFDETMPRDAEHEQQYAQFVATRCHEEGLCHFDASGVAQVVEFGSRLAEDQEKLSTRFGEMADLVREASYWAVQNGRSAVTAVDVVQALMERRHRGNYLEAHLQEEILRGTLFIATEDSVVGQVNGLSVYDTGEYSFGQPSRITARTFMGDGGVIHIERETEMSGPLHDKGVLTLYGYLGGMYAQDQPLSLTASLTFEQNYGGVEGDSASSAELYAIFSCLSRIAVKQGIAVTGSVNQHGEVQPIGGVNEKIEGFFRICQARGLTGEQGVIIPEKNVTHLMLDEDVVTAVADGQFHIWPVHSVNEGIEILTGKPAGQRDAAGNYPPGTVHDAVQKRLRELAEELKSFGDRPEEEEEDEE